MFGLPNAFLSPVICTQLPPRAVKDPAAGKVEKVSASERPASKKTFLSDSLVRLLVALVLLVATAWVLQKTGTKVHFSLDISV